ncbi:DUF3429 domain-containing protein [Polymorphobacter multimanifer]|uniref:DUF3429 domain-containing protein n=1 Tax=Polymorphobacter multimanifer TaxID=1070431 RepID=A0A841L613_9SPHN|nr:DUF3429 domain-containing protein [Polymorphobacter multimanifer]MBB6227860.1 hypothetical protein [Polymorphobacter multimanifer]
MTMPALARLLGLAGLLPLLALVVLLSTGAAPAWQGAAVALGLGYAMLILSFLGGLWWGLAAATQRPVPGWVWVVAVVPSLLCWGVMGLVGLQVIAVQQGLAITGGGLLLALLVDRALAAEGLAPAWWLALRYPLSLGLGGLSLAAAALA